MTNEQFIELKTAKLAKQAGFDWTCYKVYKDDITENNTLFTYTNKEGCNNKFNFLCSAPTQSVLQRWLREIKKISVEIYHAIVLSSDGSITIKWVYNAYYLNSNENSVVSSYEFDTFEDALEAALQKCLSLIIEKERETTERR